MKILTLAAANTKMAKGDYLDIVAAILHLAPSNASGYNVCIHASPGCEHACLNLSGRGIFAMVQEARIRKTRLLFENPEVFTYMLLADIDALQRKAATQRKRCAIRLNGTSDFPFHTFPVHHNGVDFPSVMHAFPEVQFYDYTKVPHTIRHEIPNNYHLTFSLSESNDKHALEALQRGFNVAVVLDVAETESLPETWGGYPVLDGTKHDFRFLDPAGYIVGLKPKGKRAKCDSSGFVRSPADTFHPERKLTLAIQQRKELPSHV